MKACKYFLPCGYCDKYDIPCKSNIEGLIDYNVLIGEISTKAAEEMKVSCRNCDNCEHKCEHEWEMTGSTITSQDVILHYTCSKCGEKKSLSIGI